MSSPPSSFTTWLLREPRCHYQADDKDEEIVEYDSDVTMIDRALFDAIAMMEMFQDMAKLSIADDGIESLCLAMETLSLVDNPTDDPMELDVPYEAASPVGAASGFQAEVKAVNIMAPPMTLPAEGASLTGAASRHGAEVKANQLTAGFAGTTSPCRAASSVSEVKVEQQKDLGTEAVSPIGAASRSGAEVKTAQFGNQLGVDAVRNHYSSTLGDLKFVEFEFLDIDDATRTTCLQDIFVELQVANSLWKVRFGEHLLSEEQVKDTATRLEEAIAKAADDNCVDPETSLAVLTDDQVYAKGKREFFALCGEDPLEFLKAQAR